MGHLKRLFQTLTGQKPALKDIETVRSDRFFKEVHTGTGRMQSFQAIAKHKKNGKWRVQYMETNTIGRSTITSPTRTIDDVGLNVALKLLERFEKDQPDAMPRMKAIPEWSHFSEVKKLRDTTLNAIRKKVRQKQPGPK